MLRSFFGWASSNLFVLGAVGFVGFFCNSVGSWYYQENISTWAVPGAGSFTETVPRSLRVHLAPNGKAFIDGEKQVPPTHCDSPDFEPSYSPMDG